MGRDRMTGRSVRDWKQLLTPREVEALEDYWPYGDAAVLPAAEVLDAIVQYEGGLASGYQVRRTVERVYGVKLEG